MNRSTLRGIALWSTIVTSVMTLMTSGVYVLIRFAPPGGSTSGVFTFLSVIGLLINVIHTGSLLLFLGLVHYDLLTAQRLSEHARDYLIRDLSNSTQENTSNHG
jgi:hypothetical protein